MTKSGFIAIVGRPNVGKSTLINRLVGQKVAIVSQRPQTTRNRIIAILNRDDTQMIFLDTPGFHRPKNRLGEYMEDIVHESLADVDCILLTVEPKTAPTEDEKRLIEKMKGRDIPVILVINKTDTVPKPAILMAMAAYAPLMEFKAIMPISARTGEGIAELECEIGDYMQPGPEFYPQDMVTDQPERAVVAEIIREKMLRLLSDEIPHGVAVAIESFDESRDDLIKIGACIYCEKDSHKGIIIGKNGKMLKKIGTYAREELERMFECKVFLDVFVKVDAGWRNKAGSLREFGYTREE
ncbi:MAG: GTPase Era [Clostridia bacterium]|nr:GTPase Era [Clostridia bacterium]